MVPRVDGNHALPAAVYGLGHGGRTRSQEGASGDHTAGIIIQHRGIPLAGQQTITMPPVISRLPLESILSPEAVIFTVPPEMTRLGVSPDWAMLVFAVVVYFSGRIVRPLAESYEKQKRFITDAGHEIKTPLTVLQADADILEMELGSNEWLTDMRGQLKHLSALTNDLVSLARMEEGETSLHLLETPVSDVISEAAESFRSLAQAQGKTLAVFVEPMLSMATDEKSIRQLVGILLDNALKYSPEGSEIALNFSKQSRQLKLTVTNASSAPLPKGNPDVLFERFYRVDSSRNSQTGGHGIGLSIAKAIVTAHGGRIHAATIADTALQISAQFPQKP